MAERRQPPPERRKQSDRRDYLRVPTAGRVRFLRGGLNADEVLAAELADVSHTGLRIQVDEPLVPGEPIVVEVRDEEGKCFNLLAQIVWVESEPEDRHCVGCELRVELNRRQFALLQRLVGMPTAGSR